MRAARRACSSAVSGWFEAYLGGQWHTFDARHNVPRIGRVVIARGRDAVDVAMTTSFGPTTLEIFQKMDRYNPDKTWTVVHEDGESPDTPSGSTDSTQPAHP